MTNNKKHIFTITLLIAIFTIIIGAICAKTVKAISIKKYESEIEINNAKIAKIEDIKNQLHITAELIREESGNEDEVFLSLLGKKWNEYDAKQKEMTIKNNTTYEKINNTQNNHKQIFLGNFTITHYCICQKCCGKSASHLLYGITASGTRATSQRTIAVDPKVIPFGTKVLINGNIYIAEDKGGSIKGNTIDIYVSSHLEAIQKGVLKSVPVYIIEESSESFEI